MANNFQNRRINSRIRILEVLRQSRGRHLSVEEIRQEVNRNGPSVHLATVYRALQQLTLQGQVKRTSLSQNHAHYELTNNCGVHLLCESCGRLREERLEPAERALTLLKKRLGARFQIKSWQMQVVGRCRECLK